MDAAVSGGFQRIARPRGGVPTAKPTQTRFQMARMRTLITSGKTQGALHLRLKELWEYRDLFLALVQRDIKVRYKQAALGVAWAVLQPLLSMVVFSIFFGRLAGIESQSIVPYPLFAFAGLLPWQLFAYGMTQSANSMVTEQRLITKVYFPRLIIPTAPVLSGMVDFTIAFSVMIGMMFYYGVSPTWAVMTVPLFVVFAAISSLAVGLWLSALNAIYRDVRHTVPFLTQLLLFVSPVVYPSTMVPERWHLLYALNPMAGVIDGFRWALLGSGTAPGPMLAVSLCSVVSLLIGGLYYFRHVERFVADIV